MSCAFDKERLTAFFDGELDAAERAETERHISGCSECLRDLGEIKSAASAVKILERPRAPRSIAEGVSREIAARGRVRRLDVWRGRLLVGVAAAAAVLVALNISFFSKPPAEEPLARSSSPAPVIGMARPSDVQKDAPAEGAERESAKASDRLREQGAADKAPSDGADNRARRALQADALKKADEADRVASNALRQEEKKRQAAPAAEPKAEAPLKPQAALGAKADAAPAPAAPPPAPPAAKPAPAPAPAEEARRKETADGKAEKAGELQKGFADPAAPKTAAAAPAALPEVPAYTVRGGGKDARARAEALAKSWTAPAADAESAAKPKAAVASGAPGGGRAFGSLPEPLVLEVTPEQFEALRAELAKAGVTIEAGAPESLRGAAGKDVVSGGGAPAAAKERADHKAPAETEGKSKAAAPKRRITLHFVEATPRK